MDNNIESAISSLKSGIVDCEDAINQANIHIYNGFNINYWEGVRTQATLSIFFFRDALKSLEREINE